MSILAIRSMCSGISVEEVKARVQQEIPKLKALALSVLGGCTTLATFSYCATPLLPFCIGYATALAVSILLRAPEQEPEPVSRAQIFLNSETIIKEIRAHGFDEIYKLYVERDEPIINGVDFIHMLPPSHFRAAIVDIAEEKGYIYFKKHCSRVLGIFESSQFLYEHLYGHNRKFITYSDAGNYYTPLAELAAADRDDLIAMVHDVFLTRWNWDEQFEEASESLSQEQRDAQEQFKRSFLC
jgi:hypothetical protein